MEAAGDAWSDTDFRAVRNSRAELRERDKPKHGKEGNLQRVGAETGSPQDTGKLSKHTGTGKALREFSLPRAIKGDKKRLLKVPW